MRSDLVAAALRALADAIEAQPPDAPAQPGTVALPPPPQPRGRGRPPKVAPEAPAAPAPAPAAPEADPFDAPAAVAVAPTATLDEVRASLKALAAATDQATALKVLKDVGSATNLTELKADKYGAVVVAANARQPAKPVEADPFGETTAAPAVEITLEQVKAEILKASKRTAQDTVAKVVMDLGGKAPLATGGFGPSWTALPKEKYAEVIAAVQNLPTTK